MRPTQRCSSNSWLRAQPFWRRLAADPGAVSFASTVFVSTFKHSTAGFRHPNFHPMAADTPGARNIQSVDLASGVATVAGLPGIPRQAAYNREDLVRFVGSQDVRRRGIRVEDLELISRRALDDEKAAIAGKPVPGSWPAASGSSLSHLITILSSSLACQKSVKTSCMRRHSSIVSASSSTVPTRHKSSRRGTSIIASGPFSVLPIKATFLSSFLSLRPVLQYMRGLSIMSLTS